MLHLPEWDAERLVHLPEWDAGGVGGGGDLGVSNESNQVDL